MSPNPLEGEVILLHIKKGGGSHKKATRSPYKEETQFQNHGSS